MQGVIIFCLLWIAVGHFIRKIKPAPIIYIGGSLIASLTILITALAAKDFFYEIPQIMHKNAAIIAIVKPILPFDLLIAIALNWLSFSFFIKNIKPSPFVYIGGGFVASILSLLIITVIFLAARALLHFMYEHRETIYSILSMVSWAAIIFAFIGWRKNCPSCGKWFARRKIGRDFLGESHRTKDITRTDKYRDKYGSLTGTKNRVERVTVTDREFLIHYECKYCGQEWASHHTE